MSDNIRGTVKQN